MEHIVADETTKIYQFHAESLHDKASAFMGEHGYIYNGDFPETADGQQEKFSGEESRTDKRSWLRTRYVDGRFGNPGLLITFGRHDGTGQRITKTFWSDDKSWGGLSEEERATLKKQREEYKQKATEKAEEYKKIADAWANKALQRLSKATLTPSKEAITYFSKKGLGNPYDVGNLVWERVDDYTSGPPVEKWVALAILRNANGDIRAIQELYPEKVVFKEGEPARDKNYLGKTGSLFHTIGGLNNGKDIAVTEGIATGLTVFQATNTTVVAAMDCGNLAKVVKSLKTRYPKSSITICADNDHNREGNPGLKAAKKVAMDHGCKLAIPEFPEGALFYEDGKARTDLDDLRQLLGSEAVKKQWDQAQKEEKIVAIRDHDIKHLVSDILNKCEPCDGFSTKTLPKCLHEYISSIAETTNAHPIMIMSSVFATISSFVNKRLFISENDYFQTLYTNLWMLNITKSGQFKTTALNKGARLAWKKSKDVYTEIKKIEEEIKKTSGDKKLELEEQKIKLSITNPVFPQKITTEALLEHIGQGHGGMILTSEFGGWLQGLEKSHNNDLKAVFTDIYDVPESFRYKTKSQGDHILQKPYISICGVSTLEWIKDNLKPGDVSSGFFARYLLFTPPHNDSIPPARPQGARSCNLKAEGEIKDTLEFMDESYAYKFTKNSGPYFDELHHSIYQIPKQYSERCQEILDPYLKRWSPYLLKLAMIIRLFEDPQSNELSDTSLHSAMEILKVSIKSTAKLFEGELGESPHQRKCRIIFDWICKRLNQGKQPTRESILGSRKLEGGKGEYDYVLESLVESGKLHLIEKQPKQKSVYVPNNK